MRALIKRRWFIVGLNAGFVVTAITWMASGLFPTQRDVEDYVSHVVAWLFILTASALSLLSSYVWKDSPATRWAVVLRSLFSVCCIAVLIDAVAGVIVSALLLRWRVATTFAAPVVFSIPLVLLALIATVATETRRLVIGVRPKK
jgi:hypothetical protein